MYSHTFMFMKISFFPLPVCLHISVCVCIFKFRFYILQKVLLFAFVVWCTLFKIMVFSSIPSWKCHNLILLHKRIKFNCVYEIFFFLSWWASSLVAYISYWEYCGSEHGCSNIPEICTHFLFNLACELDLHYYYTWYKLLRKRKVYLGSCSGDFSWKSCGHTNWAAAEYKVLWWECQVWQGPKMPCNYMHQ